MCRILPRYGTHGDIVQVYQYPQGTQDWLPECQLARPEGSITHLESSISTYNLFTMVEMEPLNELPNKYLDPRDAFASEFKGVA
jgi:hypothetical protein